MAKRLSRQEKIDQAVVDLINQMFTIADHAVTHEDIKDRKDAWYAEYTMTEEQNEEWVNWGQVYLRKKFKLSKQMAVREMGMINLMWGLKLDPSPFQKTVTDEQN
jgi:hypothetical protein